MEGSKLIMEITNEIWKDIPGYEGYYQASNKGRIKSIDRIVPNSRNLSGESFIKGRIMATHIHKSGYTRTILTKNSKGTVCKVHRLVALSFLPNPENKPDINHINAIKHDNRLENIEWSTEKENIQHAFKNGLHKSRAGFGNSNCKVTENQVLEIKKLLSLGKSGVAISKITGASTSIISKIKNGKTFKSYGDK